MFGSLGKDAVPTLTAAAWSLVGQLPARGFRLIIAPLVAEATGPAEWLAGRYRDRVATDELEWVALAGIAKKIKELAADVDMRLSGEQPRDPVLVVLYGADATDTVLDRAGTEALRKLLRLGPEAGVHVLGWWRSIQRLRALLAMGASVDDLGAWVALDVHGAELGPLVPGMVVSWAPRPGRGLFFDRAQHAAPEVIIVPAVGDR